MILLFDPRPPRLWWHGMDGAQCAEGQCDFSSQTCEHVVEQTGHLGSAEAVGYLLYHGGEKITETVSRLTRESLPGLMETIRFLPEHNLLTLQLAQQGLDTFPEADHFLLCDTAFFAALPPAASSYAIPYPLRQNGLKRYGGYGLCHQWVWNQVQAQRLAPVNKLISVYLGDNTNIAAIEQGKPRETSIGFTSVEGIPSATSCGNIDPTIPLYLQSSGMTFPEIERLLSRESGFTGLLGKRYSLQEILEEDRDHEIAAVRELFRYSVIKHVGAFIAVLGGIDAIAFVSDDPDRYTGFVLNISSHIGRLEMECGMKPHPENGEEGDADVPVHVYSFPYDKKKVIAEMIQTHQILGGKENGK